MELHPLEIELDDERTCVRAELLRDGRLAIGTRIRGGDGGWGAGELVILERRASVALAAWLAPLVEDAWTHIARRHQEAQLTTARDLYGVGAAAAERLAGDMEREIPYALRRRAMLLLANAIGPEMRERLVARLNAAPAAGEPELRRRLAEERDAFAYALAAAALYDALEQGAVGEAAEPDLS